VNLSQLAESIVTMFRESEPERTVQITIEQGLVARGDNSLLTMVLQNLIGNAWKYTANRQDAAIAFGKTVVNGREAYFVRDNGIGFDMAYKDKLFKVFERLHGEEFEGTGIGLATVQRIISRHDGEVWAEAELNMGAIFYFTLGAFTSSSSPT
jgi:light-regulated signal transduction histidine kinase (bacteriophytochrome)